MAATPFLDLQGNPIPMELVLGDGGTGLVLLRDGVAVKTPRRYFWDSEYEVEMNTKSVNREQDVYRRLQSSEDDRSDGVVRCLGFSPEAMQLGYMPNGDLKKYLEKHRPTRQLQLTWFRTMARALSFIHDRRVLVTDIACRNFLLDSDLSIKFCDFSESSLLPLESDMNTVDDDGYTAQVDVGLLGKVMYEVVTGVKCEVDLYKDNAPSDSRAYFPDRKSLPSTQDVWLGSIIDGCWTGQFRNAHSLQQALDSVDLGLSSSIAQSRITRLVSSVKDSISDRPIATIVGALGLATFALVVGRKTFLTPRSFNPFL